MELINKNALGVVGMRMAGAPQGHRKTVSLATLAAGRLRRPRVARMFPEDGERLITSDEFKRLHL